MFQNSKHYLAQYDNLLQLYKWKGIELAIP